MQLSLNILLDALKDYNPQNYIEEKDIAFSGVGIAHSGTQGMYTDQIYVSALKDFVMLPNARPASLIVIKKANESIPENKSLKNTIVVDFEGDRIDFFSYVQSIFSTIFNWCSKMDEYLIRNRSIQDILSLSESVIGNTITISDSSFALVAYTEGIECDCKLTSRLIKKGYHDQEAIDLFNKHRLPEKWRDAIDIYESSTCTISDYPIICKVVHYYNNYYSHIVMICNNRQITPGIKDLFKMLADHLMVCFEKQWLDNNQMPHIHDSLLISLSGPNNLSEEAVRNRARNSGLPFLAKFRFLKIATEDSSNIMLQRIERELVNIFPDAKVTLYKQALLVLLVQPLRAKDKSEGILEQYSEILKRYNAKCGVSDPFATLCELELANEQANVALSLSTPGTIMSYDNCYIRYLLSSDPQSSRLAHSTAACKTLSEILEYDKKHGTNNYDLLRTYLEFDRKATETSQVMHMHRNNVIYRIGRICEQVGIDLDDPKVRLKLLLAYELPVKTE